VSKSKKTRNLNIRVTEDQLRQLQRRAAGLGLTPSSMARVILAKYLEKHTKREQAAMKTTDTSAHAIAIHLTNTLTPGQSNSGMATPLGDGKHIWICDGVCSWAARASDVRAWLRSDGAADDEPYQSFCDACDAVTDFGVALHVLDEHGSLITDAGGGNVLSSDNLKPPQEGDLRKAGAEIAEGWIKEATQQHSDSEAAREHLLGYRFEADGDVLYVREAARKVGIAWELGATTPAQAEHLSQRCEEDIWEAVTEGYREAVAEAFPIS
jgi:hypothetical protein